jgi:hypothetical protein
MKKLIIIISLALVTIFGACTPDNDKKSASAVAFANNAIRQGFTNLLVEHVNGTIESVTIQGDSIQYAITIISLPDFYDKEFTTSMVYNFINGFSDVSFYQVWQKDESYNSYTCTVYFAEIQPSNLFLLAYDVRSNKMIISHMYEE